MIDVVIPYCDAPERLTSILLALNAQVHRTSGQPLDSIAVVIADDASTRAPDVTASTHPVTVVRLEQPGFHVAAARNLGANHGHGGIIVFLDGDTVPAPHYVSCLTAPLVDGSAALTTGHRLHADFEGLSPEAVAAFVVDPDPVRLLDEPQWLTDGLRWTDGLRSASSEVFQYVISAVLAVNRSLFHAAGGFDERFDAYGGEDWEFAYRCWNEGGHFLHVEAAHAFHDGPDVEGRVSDPLTKTIENLRIMDLVPASPTRLRGVRYEVPDIDIAVTLRAGDVRSNVIAVLSILDSDIADLRILLCGTPDDVVVISRLIGDERVVGLSNGRATPHRSSRVHVVMSEPLEVSSSTLARLCDELRDGTVHHKRVRVGTATLEAWSVRSLQMAQHSRAHTVLPVDVSGDELGVCVVGDEDVASWCRRRARDQIR